MRHAIGAVVLAGLLSAPAIVQAQGKTESPHSFTANLGVFSDYRFRGLSQTLQRPALQGGFDYAHRSGFYAGNWNSNVSSSVFPNANLEMDVYAGFKGSATEEVAFDVGLLYYYYPGSDAVLVNVQTGSTSAGRIDNTEIYGGVSWKGIGLKYSHAVSDFFGIPDTRNSGYLDLTGSFDLGSGWGLNAHIGHQKVRHFSDASYTDWRIGATKEINGYIFGLAWVDTNAKDTVYTYSDSRKTMNLGKSGGVVSVSRSF